jgi:surface polysaccharide O-acyltransferase-like enzyme
MSEKKQRLADLDWLRVLAVLLLIPFHAALIWGSGVDDHWLKDTPLPLPDLFAHFVHQWHMPLLFVIAGMAAWFSLRSRSGGQFMKERVGRLLVPLLLILLFFPLQAYYWFRINEGVTDSFLRFYPFGVAVAPAFGVSAILGVQWFLVYLFIIAAVTLPILLYLRGEKGRAVVEWLARRAEKPVYLLLFALPIVLVEVALRAHFGNQRNVYNDWANMAFYCVLFLNGYLLASDGRFREAIRKAAPVALILAVVSFGLGLTWVVGGNPLEYTPHDQLTTGWYLYMVNRGLGVWLWLVAIMGFAQRGLASDSPTLRYLSEAAMPVYVMHLAVQVALAYYVLQWGMSNTLEFVVINIGTFAACFLVYELIKRTNVTRVLFGLKPRKRERAVRQEALAK